MEVLNGLVVLSDGTNGKLHRNDTMMVPSFGTSMVY